MALFGARVRPLRSHDVVVADIGAGERIPPDVLVALFVLDGARNGANDFAPLHRPILDVLLPASLQAGLELRYRSFVLRFEERGKAVFRLASGRRRRGSFGTLIGLLIFWGRLPAVAELESWTCHELPGPADMNHPQIGVRGRLTNCSG